jgi:hypothetical protein
MKPTGFWKNFKIGEELSVSGSFIYNGLRRYHEMQQLDFTDEIFDFLYNLSAGFERLLKIAIVLFEHSSSTEQDELERSLITHSHLDLLSRLRKHVEVNLGPPQIDLLALLSKFYKAFRYDRFLLASVFSGKNERDALCDLLRKYLNEDIPSKPSIFGTENKERYRKFIHRNALKISRKLYCIIKDRANQITTYLKKVFCPNIFVDAKFKSSEYLSMPAVQILRLP